MEINLSSFLFSQRNKSSIHLSISVENYDSTWSFWHLCGFTSSKDHIILQLEISKQMEDSELLQLNAKEIFIDVRIL